MDRQLLPILRSQQQGEILALLLGDPDLELSLTEIAARLGVPHPSVHREIQPPSATGIGWSQDPEPSTTRSPADPCSSWLCQAANRTPDRYARSRQFAAGYAAKLPDGGIAGITQPVLVLDGDEGPIIRAAAAGRALARAVPHGRLVLVHRLGHLPSAPLWPELVSEISQHAT